MEIITVKIAEIKECLCNLNYILVEQTIAQKSAEAKNYKKDAIKFKKQNEDIRKTMKELLSLLIEVKMEEKVVGINEAIILLNNNEESLKDIYKNTTAMFDELIDIKFLKDYTKEKDGKK